MASVTDIHNFDDQFTCQLRKLDEAEYDSYALLTSVTSSPP
jgi:hypothetical protein